MAIEHDADGPADDDHHQRLDEAGEAGDGDVDLVFVKVGDLGEHRVERPGLLADADYLHDHRREDVGLHQRPRHISSLR